MMAGWAPYHTLRVRHSSGASLFHIAIVGAWDDYRSLGVEVDKAFFFHGAMSRYSLNTHKKTRITADGGTSYVFVGKGEAPFRF